MILENNGSGELEFMLEMVQFLQLCGFWNKLVLIDVNGDGCLDILVGNMGINILLIVSEEIFVQLYLGDFDKNGFVDFLIFFYYIDCYVLLGSKDKFFLQLLSYKKNFVLYDDYVKVSFFVEFMLEGEELVVECKMVNELCLMVFVLGGDGRYKVVFLFDGLQMLNLWDIVLVVDG